MRQFLQAKGSSEGYSLKEIPTNTDLLEKKFQSALRWIKTHLDDGVPVIVHQYWTTRSSTGHYRVITGYDDDKQMVYLNDAKAGRIVQTCDEFKKKGATLASSCLGRRLQRRVGLEFGRAFLAHGF